MENQKTGLTPLVIGFELLIMVFDEFPGQNTLEKVMANSSFPK
jgi:hypothetical protein